MTRDSVDHVKRCAPRVFSCRQHVDATRRFDALQRNVDVSCFMRATPHARAKPLSH